MTAAVKRPRKKKWVPTAPGVGFGLVLARETVARIDPLGRPTPFDHRAFYEEGTPYEGEAWDMDTGLRCACGREVVSTDDTETGWEHVGIGDMDDLTGLGEWHAARKEEEAQLT